MNRAGRFIALDRDGTIVRDRGYLADPAQLEFLPGAVEGLRFMHSHGYRIVVVTNQSAVGRGWISAARLAEIHAAFRAMLSRDRVPIDGIYCCPHAPDDGCTCRKPNTDLLLRAAADLGLDASRAIVIGDKCSDIELGDRLGATTMLVAPVHSAGAACHPQPDYVVRDLLEAARVACTLA